MENAGVHDTVQIPRMTWYRARHYYGI